jgi:transposase-like protein
METISSMVVTALDRVRVTGDPGRVADERPDPEVPEKARRRTFTAQYKLDVVAEYDAAPSGEKGAVLRGEGLCSSHVIEWRRARDVGALAGALRPRASPTSMVSTPETLRRPAMCRARLAESRSRLDQDRQPVLRRRFSASSSRPASW